MLCVRHRIFSVLSAILYLGNVTYEPAEDGEGLGVGPPHVLATLSDLLQVMITLLLSMLQFQVMRLFVSLRSLIVRQTTVEKS